MLFQYLKNLIKRPFYRIYEHHMSDLAHRWQRPRHIGIILDGNRRFARKSGLGSIMDGHARGADKLDDVLDWCYEYEIPVVTIWIFSLDNFQRDQEEVNELMKLIETKTRDIVKDDRIKRNKIRLKYIGQIERVPESLQQAIQDAEAATRDHDRFILNVAIAYGGREEITNACRDYLRHGLDEEKSIDEILDNLTPDSIHPHMYTSGLPDPDLIIRTSGEVRLGGFLLWQSAYAEFYFCDTYWPAFRKIDFLRAIRAFHQRQRRYGR